MKVGINILFLKPWLAGGTETYTKGLLHGLSAMEDNNVSYYIFCSTDVDTSFIDSNKRFTVVKYKNVSRSLAYRYFFEQFIFPFKLKKYKLDVLHSLGYVGPLYIKNHIVTIHDTNAFAHKQAMPAGKRILLAVFLKKIAKTCRHIIAVSNFSKQEIISNLHIAGDKVSVIYEACKFRFNANEVAELPAEYQFLKGTKYFVALSSTSAHKNIHTLVKAFRRVRQANGNCKLVLIGFMPAGNSIQQYLQQEGLGDDVVITGFVDDAVLTALFKNAFCFVFPSLYEGFGLPLLEAQQSGIPVISSNMGSLPEIGNNSALYFEATNAEELADKMNGLLANEAQGKELIAKGYINVQRFSWYKAAAETLQLYNRYG